MKAAFPFARARTFLLLLTLLFAVGCRGSYVVTGDPQALGDVAVGAPAAAEVVITATSPNTIVGSFGVESEQNCVVTTTLPVEFQPGAPGDLRLANGEVERIPVTLTPLGPGPFCGTFFAPEDSREAGQTSDIADPEHSTTICGNAVAGVGALELSVEDKQTVVAGDEGTYTLVATNVSDSVITITAWCRPHKRQQPRDKNKDEDKYRYTQSMETHAQKHKSRWMSSERWYRTDLGRHIVRTNPGTCATRALHNAR